MKYLINGAFKVIQKGAAVKASKLVEDEFVYDTEGDPLQLASMREIAVENGFKVKGKKTSDAKASFDKQLKNLDLPEKRKMSQTEAVQKIVKDGFANEMDENDILVEIVQSGVKFTAAHKMFQQAKIDLGLSISREDRTKKATVIMEDEEFEPSSYDDVTAMTKTLSAGIPNTNEKEALAQIRKFCKANEIDLPKKPKGSGVSFAIKAMAWMFSNMDAEADEFEEWLEEQERSEKVVERQLKVFATLKKEVASLSKETATTEDEDEDED